MEKVEQFPTVTYSSSHFHNEGRIKSAFGLAVVACPVARTSYVLRQLFQTAEQLIPAPTQLSDNFPVQIIMTLLIWIHFKLQIIIRVFLKLKNDYFRIILNWIKLFLKCCALCWKWFKQYNIKRCQKVKIKIATQQQPVCNEIFVFELSKRFLVILSC